jgi:hypothetical protein
MTERMHRDPAQPRAPDNGPGEIENRESVEERSNDAMESGLRLSGSRELERWRDERIPLKRNTKGLQERFPQPTAESHLL